MMLTKTIALLLTVVGAASASKLQSSPALKGEDPVQTKPLFRKLTGGQKVDNPPELSQYENAEVEFEPSQPLFVEPFEKCAALGRIAVMDSNRLKMLGKVTGTVLKDE